MTSQSAARPPLAPSASIIPPAGPTWRARMLSADAVALLVVIAVAALTWLPRSKGPIDLRWDGSVHYILGTSLAQGKGYRLLNEPGEIAAVQYPPLLPAIVAAHQLVLGTSDPWVVGSVAPRHGVSRVHRLRRGRAAVPAHVRVGRSLHCSALSRPPSA